VSVIHPSELPLWSTPLVDRLAAFGDRTALLGTGAQDGLTYAELASRVRDVAHRLGTARRLVLIEASNDAGTLIAHLGAQAAGCPVLLTGPGAPRDALVAAYDPDVVVTAGELDMRRAHTTHDLHPDLALLLSTSGSTGSPKLVRLSRRNVMSNARAIAEYLGIRDTDVAATTLPVHYCYGLSVVHSHLVAGASILLTDRSVTDPEFWTEARVHGVTTFPGVPHTFDLLERSGFTGAELPTLRYLTQAGGRLAPDDVRRHALRGREQGWDFVVMYGATEATARMAFLPPVLAAEAPGTIGIPIPGGSLTVDPIAGLQDPDVGELVYRGDNVMLGYAESPADLALGRTVHELRTGDLGRQRDDGLFEIVGRRSRIAKVFGLRVDLDRVERALAARGVIAAAADGGDALVLAVATGAAPVDAASVLAVVREEFGLTPSGVRLLTLADLPRLANGKVDYRGIADAGFTGRPVNRAHVVPGNAQQVPDSHAKYAAPVTGDAIATLFATLLGRTDATPQHSFRALGGDSLSYVEASLRLEELLGTLPPDWTRKSAAELAGHARPAHERRTRSSRATSLLGRARSVETSVLLRAVAIVSIVGSHANLFVLLGGAHTLFAVLGFNFARFHADLPRAERTRAVLRSVSRIVLPAMVVIGTVSLYKPELGWRQVLLLNWLLGPEEWTNPQWRYWFIEVALLMMLAAAALLVVPALDRLSRRYAFGFPLALAALGLVPRFVLRVQDSLGDVDQRQVAMGPLQFGGGDFLHQAHTVFFVFALGWAAARATDHWQRLMVSALALVSLWGYFEHDPARDAYVAIGVLLLTWVPQIRVPARMAALAGLLASASMWIYLVHWEIYPHLEYRIPVLATLLSLVAGVLAWRAWTYVEARARRRSC
jgi:acyl-CoA synthetase (AMP-forming)/AMP-acid ligase II